MQLYPFLFEPNLHYVVWGGNQLSPYKGLEPTDEPIGESWEISTLIPATIADYDVIPLNGTSKLLDAFIDNKDRSIPYKVTRFLHITQK